MTTQSKASELQQKLSSGSHRVEMVVQHRILPSQAENLGNQLEDKMRENGWDASYRGGTVTGESTSFNFIVRGKR